MDVDRAVLMSDSIVGTAEYNELLDSIKQTIATGQLRAARAVNNVLVETYWQIGRDILAQQRKQGWGAKVTTRLSADLRTARPDMRGLSARNLRYMAAFASRWPDGIGQQAAAQLPWGHVMVILDSCPDRQTSEFYAKRDAEQGWNRGRLEAMIASRLHERTQPALTTFDQSLPEADREAVRDIVKDPLILDFLAADPRRERDLSKALTDNVIRFLRELGSGFAFVGAEVPIPCGDRWFFVDLLFYHLQLHRYVVFEWKLGRFEPEHLGKLNFYVQLVDDHLRDHARQEPTLGMLLVVGRDDVTVEIALRGVSTPLAVTEWRRLPAKVRQALPTAEEFRPTVAQTIREIESTAPTVLRRSERRSQLIVGTGEMFSQQVEIGLERVIAEGFWFGEEDLNRQQSRAGVVLHVALLDRPGPGRAGTLVDFCGRQVVPCCEFCVVAGARREALQFAAHLFPHAD
jgi:predicted nuclease of restriction endonuclease-like (RecB) superfamily